VLLQAATGARDAGQGCEKRLTLVAIAMTMHQRQRLWLLLLPRIHTAPPQEAPLCCFQLQTLKQSIAFTNREKGFRTCRAVR
jgi:hypothetical protein